MTGRETTALEIESNDSTQLPQWKVVWEFIRFSHYQIETIDRLYILKP